MLADPLPAALVFLGCMLSSGLCAEEPDRMQVPAGHVILFKLQAKGVQIYKSALADDGKFKWEFEAPLANVYDFNGVLMGRHYEGPTWESIDGSKVKIIAHEAVKSDAPNSAADIPWMLIHVKDDRSDKAGAFSKVRYIQRSDTKGGRMPSNPPTELGVRMLVEYSAVYVFYD